MPMPGIEFTTPPGESSALSSRADVAMFTGLVARRDGPPSPELRERLQDNGWTEEGVFKWPEGRLDALLGIPVPVYSWAEFDALYDWQSRPVEPGSAKTVPCPLGLAVRQFFRQGGAKAYIVRTGDPLPLAEPERDEADFLAERLAAISRTGVSDGDDHIPILPGFDGRGNPADPLDPPTWLGAAAIFAVPDAAMLLMPDLIDLCAGAPEVAPPIEQPLGMEENFRPCAPPAPTLEPEERIARPEYRAPRLDADGFRRWSSAMAYAVNLLSRPKGPAHRRDVILIGAMPLPSAKLAPENAGPHRPLELLADGDLGKRIDGGAPAAILDEHVLGSRHVQLGYPWLSTPEGRNLPEGLQSPDGALAGMVARKSLSAGAFRSAAGQVFHGSVGLFPKLSGSEIAGGDPAIASDPAARKRWDWMGERLCLLGPKNGEIRLISDATLAHELSWRIGGISRLMGIILRASRYLGDDLMFEPSGPGLWNRLRISMEMLLDKLWGLGAFSGASRSEAFTVRCDRGTMTQSDIDAGRVICEIGFAPAFPVDRIIVSLALLDAPQKLAEAA